MYLNFDAIQTLKWIFQELQKARTATVVREIPCMRLHLNLSVYANQEPPRRQPISIPQPHVCSRVGVEKFHCDRVHCSISIRFCLITLFFFNTLTQSNHPLTRKHALAGSEKVNAVECSVLDYAFSRLPCCQTAGWGQANGLHYWAKLAALWPPLSSPWSWVKATFISLNNCLQYFENN